MKTRYTLIAYAIISVLGSLINFKRGWGQVSGVLSKYEKPNERISWTHRSDPGKVGGNSGSTP